MMKSCLLSAVCFALASPLLAAAQTAPLADAEIKALHEPQVIARSLVLAGDTARLQRVFAKAKAGGPVTIATLGGSITQGARATQAEARYANRLADWWRRTFPKAQIVLVNAGIGGTGSNYGSLRVARDVLSKNPDFVVLDFAVNDKPTLATTESFEGVVRQLLADPAQPAVALLFMSRNDGTNAQDWEVTVGDHYQLPMVSYRDAVQPEVTAGRVHWETIGSDVVHPTDAGHAYVADLLGAMLEKALAKGGTQEAATPLPAPLYSGLYEHTTLREAADLQPISNQGWAYDVAKKAWCSAQPGSVVEFKLPGTLLMLMNYHLRAPMGKVRIQVDELPPIVNDAWFDQTWGGYRETLLLGRDLPPGNHRVRIELLEEKNPQSEGHEYRLMGLGSAGAAASR